MSARSHGIPKKTWVDEALQGTAVTSSDMNRIEEGIYSLTYKPFSVLYESDPSSIDRTPNLVLQVPNVGQYSSVLVTLDNRADILYFRKDVGRYRSQTLYFSNIYFFTIAISDWSDNSLTFLSRQYTAYTNPALGSSHTRNAGDTSNVTRIIGVWPTIESS